MVIIGGKSAILLAIQICLGSRAHDTARANSLAKLVRTDAEYEHCYILLPFSPFAFTFIMHMVYHCDNDSEAKLTVELANEGPGAFKPSVFGKSIFITRIIKKKGGGAYSIHGNIHLSIVKWLAYMNHMIYVHMYIYV